MDPAAVWSGLPCRTPGTGRLTRLRQVGDVGDLPTSALRYIEIDGAFAHLVAAGLGRDGGGRETIIFDTDSGLFGDDGASLVMLMRSPPAHHIAGITVVPGNVWPEQGSRVYVPHPPTC